VRKQDCHAFSGIDCNVGNCFLESNAPDKRKNLDHAPVDVNIAHNDAVPDIALFESELGQRFTMKLCLCNDVHGHAESCAYSLTPDKYFETDLTGHTIFIAFTITFKVASNIQNAPRLPWYLLP
jgi:hypothetical protein